MSIDSTIDLRSGVVYTSDIVFGVLLVLALIEATRRSVGTSLAIVTGCFILYGFFGQYMPGFLAHVGMDLPRFISIVYAVCGNSRRQRYRAFVSAVQKAVL